MVLRSGCVGYSGINVFVASVCLCFMGIGSDPVIACSSDGSLDGKQVSFETDVCLGAWNYFEG